MSLLQDVSVSRAELADAVSGAAASKALRFLSSVLLGAHAPSGVFVFCRLGRARRTQHPGGKGNRLTKTPRFPSAARVADLGLGKRCSHICVVCSLSSASYSGEEKGRDQPVIGDDSCIEVAATDERPLADCTLLL